ncbi:hypothetical protein [Runella slithyformis]|uniref:Uncharacterized protein n=1 Tax=Runella slithyformis (strain ATCC 29530 / DSM 19594 / LMG 11500 / NCIMB 11436 / LSU 4) TaxID=761193 RepID=A0A7U3ZIA9_RUNSL|nr:hypothetical protein [Runella slithyformis]AEI47677.1 hypothetical protein Runsl_1250 [Runella slithyformis DSM 19594]
MKTVNWWWILWGIVVLILGVLGISYAQKSVKRKEKKTIAPTLAAALNTNQTILLSLSLNRSKGVVEADNKEFSENEFSSEFA